MAIHTLLDHPRVATHKRRKHWKSEKSIWIHSKKANEKLTPRKHKTVSRRKLATPWVSSHGWAQIEAASQVLEPDLVSGFAQANQTKEECVPQDSHDPIFDPKTSRPGTCNILAMFLAKLQYIFCPRIRGVLKGSRCQSQSISILSGWWRCLANVCSSVLYYPTINVDIIHSTFFQVGGAFSCWGDCQRKRCCLQEESQQHRGTKPKTRELFKPYPYPFHGAFTVGLDQAVDHDLKEEAQAARVVVLGSFERAELRIGRSSWKWRGCCRHWRRTSLPFTILDWWANSLTKQSPCSGTKTFC